MSIFEQATKTGLRFKAQNGLVTTEDLWCLTLTNLDAMAKGYRKELREADDSFIDTKSSNDQLELKFEIVKHIISSKIADRDEKIAARDKAARKQEILGVLAQKKSDSLLNMSVEDLEKELKNL